MEAAIRSLHEYVATEGRVCPLPVAWNKLWEMLPDRHRKGASWSPPPPLILAAWWETPAISKRLRLAEHIQYAANHNAFETVDAFLRALPPDQWAYGSGTETVTEYRTRQN